MNIKNIIKKFIYNYYIIIYKKFKDKLLFVIMKVVLVCIFNFQAYIKYNLYNLLLFNNNEIIIITNTELIQIFNNLILDLKIKFININIKIININELDDLNFNSNSKLDKQFRNGFWHLCSLRLIYLFSYIKKYNIENCIHIENDVLCYENFQFLEDKFVEKKIYATFDAQNRVIPGIIFIPNYLAFLPIIQNYNNSLNDMENLAQHDENVIIPFPIFTNFIENNKYTKNFNTFSAIFDAAAMGQYLGGVDNRNIDGDTRGFINETCVIKYNNYKFYWIKSNNLYKPYILINLKLIPIINLHIHSKLLQYFLSDNPVENKFINFI
jgi:hypothetical protein